MARKKLLSEGEIRQFMKLANLRPIAQQRLNEYGMGSMPPGQREDEELPGDEGPMDLGADDEAAPEAPLDVDMAPEDDLAAMEDEGGAEVDEELAQQLAQGFADVMADVLGVAVEVEGDAMPDAMDDEVVDDMEAAADVAPEGGEESGADMMGGMEDEDEDPVGGRDMYESQDKIVAEVAKRVAARLQRESRKEQMVDQLAERIMKRLTNKKVDIFVKL